MFGWLENNLGTIAVLLVLIIAIVAVIFVMRRDKKRGISSCGGSCEGCAMNCHCVANQKNVSHH